MAVSSLAFTFDGPAESSIPGFDEFVREEMDLDQTPGVSIAFLWNGKLWSRGYGYSDLENKVAATSKTMYRLASVSKPITAVAVLQMVEQGKIQLDEEVQKYVPYFPRKKWPVTVRQLLGHLGGISHYKNYEIEGAIKEHKNTREAMAIFENFDLVAEPGTKYSYSTYGYNLLAAIVESASGKSFGEYMEEHVWKPAGMRNTRLDDPYELIPNRARGYQLVNGRIMNSNFVDISSRFGGGGTRSTVEDMVLFAEALNRGKLLKDPLRNEMFESMRTRAGEYTDYGYGWSVAPVNGHFFVSHSGGQPETSTQLYLFPRENFAAAAATNFEEHNPRRYLQKLAELVLGPPWRTSAYSSDQSLAVLLQGLETAYDRGHAYYEQTGKAYRTNPSELNAAFLKFRHLLDLKEIRKNPARMSEEISAAIHPAHQQPLLIVGSYIAQQLSNWGNQKSYAAGPGAIGFFSDYILGYRRDRNFSDNLKLARSSEKVIEELNHDWQKTSQMKVWSLPITRSTFSESASTMAKQFAGAKVYPDLSQKFLDLASRVVARGELSEASQIPKVALNIYPQSDSLLSYDGVLLAALGDSTNALAAWKKAIARKPEGEASAQNLASSAYDLAFFLKPVDALRVVFTAQKIYPRNPDLEELSGDFYERIGEREKAISAYHKTLELDPNRESSKEALARLNKK
jgi:CubicO group peptidase (beta-lactamase class C family)